jgi:hypothetical protein
VPVAEQKVLYKSVLARLTIAGASFEHQELQRLHLDAHLEQMVPESDSRARRMALEARQLDG